MTYRLLRFPEIELIWFRSVFTFRSLFGSVNVYFMVGMLLNLIETTVMKPNKNKTEKNLILTYKIKSILEIDIRKK